MYLVDTSIWIDYFNKIQNPVSRALRKMLLSQSIIGINNHIYMEILQGISNNEVRNNIKKNLDLHTFYTFTNGQESYEKAAFIYSSCRKQGITIRSSIDCLIAQCAIENDLILLHNDKDFDKIASIIPTLKTQKV